MSSLVNISDVEGIDVVKVDDLPNAGSVNTGDWIVVNKGQGPNAITTKANLGEVFNGTVEASKEAAQKATQEANRATNEADRAASSAALALTAEKAYPTVEDAQAAIDAGTETNEFFWVRSTREGFIVEEYQNVSGVATPVGRGILSDELLRNIIGGVRWNDNQEIVLDITDPDSMSLWRLLSDGTFGTVLTKLTPDGPVTKNMALLFDEDFEGIRFQDQDGLYVTLVDENGVVAPHCLRNTPELTIKPKNDSWLSFTDFDGFQKELIDGKGNLCGGNYKFETTSKGWLVLKDPDGFDKVIVDNQGNIVGIPTSGFDKDAIARRNISNLAYSRTVKSNHNPNIKRLSAAINHILWFGQSLSTQQEGFPAISTAAYLRYENLMIGESPRPSSRASAAFVPVGAVQFNPLKAVVQSIDGARILNETEIAALVRGAGNEGEGGVAAVNMLRKMFLDFYSLDKDPSRKFLLSTPGVNGRTIEQLSVGANPEIYNRLRQAVSLGKQLSEDKDYAVSSIVWIQGEWNYGGNNGGSRDKDTYKRNMGTLFNDIYETAKSAAGEEQWQRPPVFMYQTGGQYTRDDVRMSIGMAQFEFCKENDYAFLATPAYPFPDKGGHLDANGYRWMDMQFGKVMYKVQVLGEGWEPLHPIKIEVEGNEMLVSYHVPSPPLQFRPCYINSNATMFDDKGFTITNAAGSVIAIDSVEIVADTIIRIKCNSAIPAGSALWYGDNRGSHRGSGNVFDSDDFKSTEVYVYEEGKGFYPEANIPALVGKPYPLNNASVQWYQQI